ncbi:MAG: ABC transporter substrate-binding protein [Geminicoccaceae bacterium]
MGHSFRTTILAATVLASVGMTAQVRAETPPNMLVLGMRIDDIITMDPAEVFELNAGELSANIYDRVMMFEPEDLTSLVCGVCETYAISEDGKTIDFTMREGQTFHSGNPVRAEDVVWSLQRVIKLNKTPAFIFSQFGWTPENVEEMIKVTDGGFRVQIVEDFSPGLVLNALAAGVASVVDKELVMANEVDGDLGYAWLKDKSAGSGAFKLISWNANETVMLEAFENYRHGAPAMKRVVARHVPEPAASAFCSSRVISTWRARSPRTRSPGSRAMLT